MLYLILSYGIKQFCKSCLLFYLLCHCLSLSYLIILVQALIILCLLLQRIVIWFLLIKLLNFNLSCKFTFTFFKFHISPLIKISKAFPSLINKVTDSLSGSSKISSFSSTHLHIIHSPKGKYCLCLFCFKAGNTFYIISVLSNELLF